MLIVIDRKTAKQLHEEISELCQDQDLDGAVMPAIMQIIVNMYLLYRGKGRAKEVRDSMVRFLAVIEEGMHEDEMDVLRGRGFIGWEALLDDPQEEEIDMLPGEMRRPKRKVH